MNKWLATGFIAVFNCIAIGQSEMYFEAVSQDHSGIKFTNTLNETIDLNYLNFQYMYNGGGVAIGDINNDGLPDIYFTGNQVSDKLYLNKGNMVFQDITKKALDNKVDEGWHTGVTMADVNQDGWLDIYVSRSGSEKMGDLKSNLLYINKGNKTFDEQSEKYGVNTARATNQSAFFDMDNDGDLDLYVMNRPYPVGERVESVNMNEFPYSDQLYENQGGVFVDISAKAGIKNFGFGLGISISDFNEDGFQDIYISNDYIGQDYMYINQKNKTFREEIKLRTKHIEYNGMGSDVADIDNDGHVDFMVVDMAVDDHIKSKKNMAGMNRFDFWKSVEFGNQLEYMFNALQLNNGNGTFSDIALLSGVAKTDWSWGPLIADFDNDGFKDIIITNGFKREVRDNDYLKKLESLDYKAEDFQEVLEMAAETKVANYFFKNTGQYKFEDVTSSWKMDVPINSNGAAYADLDLDGDLDLVVNNMDTTSYILENKLKSKNHYLKIDIDKGYEGAKIYALADGRVYYHECQMTRGFQSSVDKIIHIGLGKIQTIDQLQIVFSNGKSVIKENVKAGQTLKISSTEATENERILLHKSSPVFVNNVPFSYKHQEFVIDDFSREVLLPHKMSQLGPLMSSGDVNGDGLTDFFISGSRKFAGALFMQLPNGKFDIRHGPWEVEKEKEDLGSLLFDCDNDGDLDLYIVSGSNEYHWDTQNPNEIAYNENLQDGLYINDGKAVFTNETYVRLPKMINSGQSVVAADYDNDGDLDLFVGGRQIPGKYPYAPNSYLLENGKGKFKDVTDNSPDLKTPGMITDAEFVDIDGDTDLDLICVGEWMPISVFINEDNKFINKTKEYGLANTVGWWMSIASEDLNSDGKPDFVIGNIGQNNKFHPSENKPLEIYVNDFDENGTLDIVLGKHTYGSCYPVRGRECSSEQMPFLKDKFPNYDSFANADLVKIYGDNKLNQSLHLTASNFSSCILMSSTKGYKLSELPVEAQFGPINQILLYDFNQDNHLDILTVGNNYVTEVETERYDASRGCLLIGNGKGEFTPLKPSESGFMVTSDARDMIIVDNAVIVSSNNDYLKKFVFK
ncbi:VCBS repeat-containing protein [Paracrocinitomix mangrovi]|uniref:VCBS repeat-containing protein n=1 Tax=Paracrocinitomix mangrovi TaxID=2862509 RepID=UPI001C8DB29A|nr:VCBS repeat-containing protein [Paracrocinitomix mangrovi]UKN02862.1 VCBS repeat-containing protein [Paracrocinitomix mangrovi]